MRTFALPLPSNAAYLTQLPLKSEAAVDAFIDAGFAVEVDTGHCFLCRS